MALLKRHFRLLTLLIPLLVLFGVSMTFGQEDELTLDNADAYVKKNRAAVTFPHEVHMNDIECLTCHHEYEDGENVLDESTLEEGNPDIRCSACHTADADITIKQAYHRQCMGCHRNLRKAGDATGPELCGECHVK